jgi:archaellum component FlaC
MASIGTLELGVNITGAVEAKERVNNLQVSVEEVGDTSENTSNKMGVLGDSLSRVTEFLQDNVTGFRRFSNFASIAKNSLMSFKSGLGSIGGALSGGTLGAIGSKISGAIAGGIGGGSISGAITSALSAISATTLAAIGAGIVAGLGIVTAFEKLGILDFFAGLGDSIRNILGGSIVDMVRAVLAPLTAFLAIVGGFATGFARNINKGIIPAIKAGFATAGEGLSQLGSSIAGYLADLQNVAKFVGTKLAGAFTGVKSIAGDILSIINKIISKVKSAPSSVSSFGSDAISSLPGSNIAGDIVGGVQGLAPNLDVGGTIKSDGIANVHKGEVVVPADNVGSSSESVSKEVTVNNPRFEFNNSQGLDNMSRTEKRNLARKLADDLGDEILRSLQ